MLADFDPVKSHCLNEQNMAHFMNTFNNLSREKRNKLLRLIFQQKATVRQTGNKTSKSTVEPQHVYKCPKCSHEDKSLAMWRRIQTRDEKWNEAVLKWYKRKKCQREVERKHTNTQNMSREALFDQIKMLQHFSFQVQSKLDTAKDPLLQFGNKAEEIVYERSSKNDTSFLTSTQVEEEPNSNLAIAHDDSILRDAPTESILSASSFWGNQNRRCYLTTLEEESDNLSHADFLENSGEVEISEEQSLMQHENFKDKNQGSFVIISFAFNRV